MANRMSTSVLGVCGVFANMMIKGTKLGDGHGRSIPSRLPPFLDSDLL